MRFFKIKTLALVLSLCLLFSGALVGCSDDKTDGSNADKYVGKYESTFVDSQDNTDSISFSLEIDDGTFLFTRKDSNNTQDYTGSWKAYTQSDASTQLLCLIEYGYSFTSYGGASSDAWKPYFTLYLLDDGTLMATPGSTVGGSFTLTAFGKGSETAITLVLFEKK